MSELTVYDPSETKKEIILELESNKDALRDATYKKYKKSQLKLYNDYDTEIEERINRLNCLYKNMFNI